MHFSNPWKKRKKKFQGLEKKGAVEKGLCYKMLQGALK